MGDYQPRPRERPRWDCQEAIKARTATAAPSMGKRILIANGVQYNGAVISGGYIEDGGRHGFPDRERLPSRMALHRQMDVANIQSKDMVAEPSENQVSIRGLALAELDFRSSEYPSPTSERKTCNSSLLPRREKWDWCSTTPSQ